MAPPDKNDATDPAARNAQLQEEQIRQQNAGKDAADSPFKPHDKADPAKLQDVVPRSTGNIDQDHSVAAQWGRDTYGSTPRDITFGTESGKVIFGKEYNENGKPMLLAPDGTRYEGAMNKDGNGIASWQQVRPDGKLGPAMNVTAERSGLPANPAKPETYVNSNQTRVRDGNEGGGNPSRPALPVGDNSTNQRAQRPAEAVNQTLNFAPLHKGDVPPTQVAKANTPDAGGSVVKDNAAGPRNFGDLSRAERRDIQTQMRADGGGGNNWNQYLDKGVSKTPGGEKLVARGLENQDKQNQPAKPDKVDAKPEIKQEQQNRAEKGTAGGGQSSPFEVAPRQQKPVNEAQPAKPDVTGKQEAVKARDAGVEPSRAKPGADIFPVTPQNQKQEQLIGLLKSNPEAAKHLADLINAMQSGKAIMGKDNIDAVKLLQGLKPEQLTGLRNALSDGKFNFDMKQLDSNMQANLSKAFENLAKGAADSPGRPAAMQDLGAGGRVLDLLQGKQFDKVPTGDQSRQILAELFKGLLKDSSSPTGSADLSALIGRSLVLRPGEIVSDGLAAGQIPGMKFDLKDAGPLVQTLMARMELGKINEGSITQLGKMADSLAQKLDTKDGATLEVKAELKTQNTLDIGKLGDSVRSAILNGELGRAVGREQAKDSQAPSKDAPAGQNALQQDDGSPIRQNELTAAQLKTEQELTQKRLEEESAKQKKQEENAEAIKQKGPTPEQLAEELAQKQRLEEQRKAQEKEEKERKEKEEKKRREDAERVHVVKKGETLHLVSRKYFSNDKNSQIIYARNKSTIKVVNYKGQPYCSLKEGQKLYIPSPKFVDNFMKGTTSYNHINFGKIPFATPEEELAFLFGGADLGAIGGLLGANKKRPSLFNHDKDEEPPTRRSFSGKDGVDDEERRANVEQILNPAATAKKAVVEMEGIKHTVRLGETLSSIALRRYGQAAYWRLIAWKNKLGLVDSTAHSKMTRGLILYMPTNDEMSAYDADPDRMLCLIPSKTGIFIESENRIVMPALKVCAECGRTTLYTAQSCMRCQADLSDVPIIIDALGVGVELDLIDLDGHLPGEDSDDSNGNGSGENVVDEHAHSDVHAEHKTRYHEELLDAPTQQDLDAMCKELTDSVVPYDELEHMDPAVAAAMCQSQNTDEVSHVGDIPLPDVAFARRMSQRQAALNESNAIAASAAQQSFAPPSQSDDVPAISDAEAKANALESVREQEPTPEPEAAVKSIDELAAPSRSERDNQEPQTAPQDDRHLEAADVMQHTEEDEAAMMELFPDCDSIIDESILKCEYVDEMVRIVERGEVDSKDGLCVTLEMVSDGEWSRVCQYRIYNFNCFIEFYCRANGSKRPERVQEKSLQSKIAGNMAWNHFNRSWQELCTEFWHS